MSSDDTTDLKPENGVAGLRHWRHDLVAGLMVSIVSLPLSLGIAVASGAPPITGVISAIIAGLVFPLLGGSYVTISGPAAGLAPALLAGMTVLGRGDLAAGYPLLLVAIFFAGVVQVILSLAKAARVAAIFPTAVVEGMLASIGLLIFVKQLPHLFGVTFEAHEFFEYVAEVPRRLAEMNAETFALGATCLALFFLLTSRLGARLPLLRRIPPQLTVVGVGIALAAVVGLDPAFLVSIPDQLVEGIHLPHFGQVFADASLWWPIAQVVITLTLIDGVESLATTAAIDRIDPFKRRSNPDRTLMSMAVANMTSSLVGGLTIIPGGVKSKVCIIAGGRTLWANFYNAAFLLAFLVLIKDAIRMTPLPALAAVLMYTGYRMFEPRIWRHQAHAGREELAVFAITVLSTLLTDLLAGIVIGTVAQLVIDAYLAARGARLLDGAPVSRLAAVTMIPRTIVAMFRSPVARTEMQGGVYRLHLRGALVSFNSREIERALAAAPREARSTVLHFADVALIDHSTCDNLFAIHEEQTRAGRGGLELKGLERMRKLSHAPAATRVAVGADAPAATRPACTTDAIAGACPATPATIERMRARAVAVIEAAR